MRKILVVDDDHDILTVVKIVLNMHNFKVQTLSKPEEIHDTIKSFSPDLILLDVALGSADGRKICKGLKQSNETKHIPVLLFSAHYDLINDIEECLADGLISKPFETITLVNTISKVIA
jgi:DNA-binding response OmpR family regulator